MSDDFGTVSVRRGDRAREIEALRERYRTHRETITRLVVDAPTDYLAGEYHRLIAAIDDALRKLDELEGRAPAAPAVAPAVATPAAALNDTQRQRTSPGQRPLVAPPDGAAGVYEPPPTRAASPMRSLVIIVVGLAVVGAIAWLIWRASSERRGAATPPVVEQPTTATTTATPTGPADTGTMVPAVTPAPASSSAASIKVTPAVQDYGIIRRGTRAVRQFELTNTGSVPITIQVARSTCRCLYYDYNNKKVAPNAHETITVTVDGARAKSAAVDEQLAVTAKEDPSASATIAVRAAIK